MSADSAHAILSVFYLALVGLILWAGMIRSETMLLVCGVLAAMDASLGIAIGLNGHAHMVATHIIVWALYQLVFVIMSWWIERARALALEREARGRYRGLKNV